MTNVVVGQTGIRSIDSLMIGAKWGDTLGAGATITYSFPTAGAYWESGYGYDEISAGWYGLDDSQKEVVRQALSAWALVADITFVEVDDRVQQGDIRIAYSYAVTGNTTGWAYGPNTGSSTGKQITPSAEAGDIWLNPTTDFSAIPDGSPSDDYLTLIHEIGHALGLKHPFESSGTGVTLPDAEDSTQYTVMSYTLAEGAGLQFERDGSQYIYYGMPPLTPMLYDIQAIQYLYGANDEANAGDTLHLISQQPTSPQTIWDSGGNDTLSINGHSLAATIDLNPGAFSSIGATKSSSFSSYDNLSTNNIAIADGVYIENAVGGSGNDSITGNSQNNRLTGQGGNDTLNGGGGVDTAVYSQNRDSYTVTDLGNNTYRVSSSFEGTDILTAMELLEFADTTVALGNNQLPPTSAEQVDFTPVEGEIAYFLIQLSAALLIDSTVTYSTRNGTALAGEDYVAVSGSLTLAAGETSTTIAVQTIDDNDSEGSETFELVLTNPSGGIFADSQIELVASRTIIDNDSLVG